MNLPTENLPLSWQKIFQQQSQQPYYKALCKTLDAAYRSETVYPPEKQLLTALNYFELVDTKVVILGQDPYHGVGQAHGLSFSVPQGVPFPPSLRNIFKELHSDLGLQLPFSGDLTAWSKQGVLLLNTSLTVLAGKAGSHAGIGWQQLTDSIIREVSLQSDACVFLLWGKHAQTKAPLIDAQKHLVLESVHPSPLSAHRGFFGNQHFSQANKFLTSKGRAEVDFRLE